MLTPTVPEIASRIASALALLVSISVAQMTSQEYSRHIIGKWGYDPLGGNPDRQAFIDLDFRSDGSFQYLEIQAYRQGGLGAWTPGRTLLEISGDDDTYEILEPHVVKIRFREASLGPGLFIRHYNAYFYPNNNLSMYSLVVLKGKNNTLGGSYLNTIPPENVYSEHDRAMMRCDLDTVAKTAQITDISGITRSFKYSSGSYSTDRTITFVSTEKDSSKFFLLRTSSDTLKLVYRRDGYALGRDEPGALLASPALEIRIQKLKGMVDILGRRVGRSKRFVAGRDSPISPLR